MTNSTAFLTTAKKSDCYRWADNNIKLGWISSKRDLKSGVSE